MRICAEGFVKRTMEIVVRHTEYEEDLVFCIIRYFLFSCLIHARPTMKEVEKELGVDFFSSVLAGIGEKWESRNEQMQDIVRSSAKVVSTQALKFGHMLTPEAGNTQWMEEHEEEACKLLRKPLGFENRKYIYRRREILERLERENYRDTALHHIGNYGGLGRTFFCRRRDTWVGVFERGGKGVRDRCLGSVFSVVVAGVYFILDTGTGDDGFLEEAEEVLFVSASLVIEIPSGLVELTGVEIKNHGVAVYFILDTGTGDDGFLEEAEEVLFVSASLVIEIPSGLVELTGVEIKNHGVAIIELHQCGDDAVPGAQVVIGKKLLMTAPESRNKTDANMYGTFTIEISAQLSKFKIICKQPFNKSFPFGLESLTLHPIPSPSPPSVPREQCELSRWGLPGPILAKYQEMGVTHMFPWQAECLSQEGVLSGGRNLVYCAPTSAGKTLVAEILLLKRVLETQQKVLFVLPFVSVAGEKTRYLEGLLELTRIKVGGFFGTKSPPGGFGRIHIAVCTIEKANSIVNRLAESGELSEQIGCVVVDELHMVGDSSRGYLLELLLTKIKYQGGSNVQIVGMSATLPNLDLLSKWLDAALYTTTFRPVPLTQVIKIGNAEYDIDKKKVKDLPSDQPHEHIVYLCQETLQSGHNVLVFCNSKNWTEKLCQLISQTLLNKSDALDSTLPLQQGELEDVVAQLGRLPMAVDPVLAACVDKGVAYHHAGLTTDEREIVETAFRRGFIRVLIATSTLSAGVNLPARRVIIRSPKFAGSYMSPLVYQQMAGRAGRMGVDSAGESILICKKEEENAVWERVVTTTLAPVSSCLRGALDTPMKRAVLEVIASGVATTHSQIDRYFQSTLLAAEEKNDSTILDSALEFLIQLEFVSKSTTSEEGEVLYTATQLGAGTLNSALPPSEALDLLAHLQLARRNFNLETELQLVFEVTPLSISRTWPQPDWYGLMRIWNSLSPAHLRAAENVGVSEAFLAKASAGIAPQRTDKQKMAYQTNLRFFAALALLDVIGEMPIDAVATKYKTNRGLLQSLQTSASSYAGQVAVFCEKLAYSTLSVLLSDLQVRLFSGVPRELCDLVRIPLVSGVMARALYNSGYTTVAKVASGEVAAVARVLEGTMPFKGGKETRSWLDRRHGLSEWEAVEGIVRDARELLSEDLEGLNVKFDLGSLLGKRDESSAGIGSMGNKSVLSIKSGSCLSNKTGSKRKSSSVRRSNALYTTEGSSKIDAPPSLSQSYKLLNTSNRRRSSFTVAKPNQSIVPTNFSQIDDSFMDFMDIDTDLLDQIERDVLGSKKRAPVSVLQKSPVKKPKNLTTVTGTGMVSPSKRPSKQSPKKSPLKCLTFSSVVPAKQITENHPVADIVKPSPNPGPSKTTKTEPTGMMELESALETLSPIRGPSDSSLFDDFSFSSIREEPPPTTNEQPPDPQTQKSKPVPPVKKQCLLPPAQASEVKKQPIPSPKKQPLQPPKITSPLKSQPVEGSGHFIIDVTGDGRLFEEFLRELKSKRKYAMCVAWEHSITGEISFENLTLAEAFSGTGRLAEIHNAEVYGIAFCWSGLESYYVSLRDTHDGAVCTPPIHPSLSVSRRVRSLREVLLLTATEEEEPYRRIGADMKLQWQLLATKHSIPVEEDMGDVKIAGWLLDPESPEPTLLSLVKTYTPGVIERCGMKNENAPVLGSARVKASLSAVLVWNVHEELERVLLEKNLLTSYWEVECPVMRVLARMELNGFGACRVGYAKIRSDLQRHMKRIEEAAVKCQMYCSTDYTYHHMILTNRPLKYAGKRSFLAATSTLSAGVNLPARRVIIRSPKFAGSYMSPLVYQQMAGRAGRMGVDSAGESILICKKEEENAVWERVVTTTLAPVSSCLRGALDTPMKRAVLEIIASGVATTHSQIDRYFQSTLLAAEEKNDSTILDSALEFLIQLEFISKASSPEGEVLYTATQLGAGTLNSALPPSEALDLLAHLQLARRNFNLETELQLVFEVTPLSISRTWPQPDWYGLMRIWNSLSPAHLRAAENVGVSEAFLAKASAGIAPQRTDKQKMAYQTNLRFFAALALLDVIGEMPIDAVATKYKTNRGLLQSLQTSASSYAGQVAVFCEKLAYSTLSVLLSDLQVRLFSGVPRELCDLVRIPLVSGVMARALYNSGYTTVAKVASGEVAVVARVLEGTMPFKGGKEIRSWLDRRHGLSEWEAVEGIVRDARELLTEDLEGLNVKFDLGSLLGKRDESSAGIGSMGNKSVTSIKSGSSLSHKTASKRKSSSVRRSNALYTTEGSSKIEAPPSLSQSSKLLNTSNRRRSSFTVAKPNQSIVPTNFSQIEDSFMDFMDIDTDLLDQIERDVLGSKKRAPGTVLQKSPVKKSKNLTTVTGMVSPSKRPAKQSPKKSPLKCLTFSSVVQAKQTSKTDPAVDIVKSSPNPGPSKATATVPSARMELESALETLSPIRGPSDSSLFDDFSFSSIRVDPPPKSNNQPSDPQTQKSKPVTPIKKQPPPAQASEVKKQPLPSLKKHPVQPPKITSPLKSQPVEGSGHFIIDVTGRLAEIHNAEVYGIAFCWSGLESYYVSLRETHDGAVCTPPIHPSLSVSRRVKSLREVLLLTATEEEEPYRRIGADMKLQWQLLATKHSIPIEEDMGDVKIAGWLLDPESPEPALLSLVKTYTPGVIERCGMKDENAPVLGSARVKASLSAVLVWNVHEELERVLLEKNLLTSYWEVECPVMRVLARMELNGFGACRVGYAKIRSDLQRHMKRIEEAAVKLAKCKFSLSSPEQVSDVLFNRLHLPPHDPDKPAPKIRGKKKFFSTSKAVLERLSKVHVLPSLILVYRRTSRTLSETFGGNRPDTLLPCPGLNMDRVYTHSITHTATGRVSFHEPNLQNTPNEFSLDPPQVTIGTQQKGTVCTPRSMYIPYKGAVLLAADYRQLELRILGHLSGDGRLRPQLNDKEGDVFCTIAASWKQIPVGEVTESVRNQAKQISYGIIYGMGARSLAEKMECSEKEAEGFMDGFKDRYKGIPKFISRTIESCKKDGYVKTMVNRVRFLPEINSDDISKRERAERQAVNTVIQGSAADLVKVAMVNIDKILQDTFPDCHVTHSERTDHITSPPRGAYLVLQLHDELIYEVNRDDLGVVAGIVREEMEGAMVNMRGEREGERERESDRERDNTKLSKRVLDSSPPSLSPCQFELAHTRPVGPSVPAQEDSAPPQQPVPPVEYHHPSGTLALRIPRPVWSLPLVVWKQDYLLAAENSPTNNKRYSAFQEVSSEHVSTNADILRAKITGEILKLFFVSPGEWLK
eukprot:sb/3460354/